MPTPRIRAGARGALAAVPAIIALALLATGCTDGGDESGGDDAGTTAPDTTTATGTGTEDSSTVDPDHRDPSRCPDDPWMATGIDPEERADRLIAAMTLEQKVGQTHGTPRPEDFRVVPGLEELCIPDLTVTNGPAGVGASTEPLGSDPATALPAPLAVAATWDPEMSHEFGDLVGTEMVQTGRNLLESPDVDLARVPYNGRTFEAFGEDPHLVSAIAVPQIRAVQDHGVLAMVKHYVANNQETDRTTIDARVSDRALHELYLPPFEASVTDGDVASVMCAYNRTNGEFNCQNEPLLTGVLRDQWGFEGFVQSDFGATHASETALAVQAGMDLEMPSSNIYGPALLEAVNTGAVTEDQVDELLHRRLTQMFRFGLFDHPPDPQPIPVEEHARVAQRIGAAGTVLLRNEDDLLPLDEDEVSSVAVVGPWSTEAATGGGGSSIVNPLRTVSPVDGITDRAGDDVEVMLPDGDDVASAVAAAEAADVAVVVVGEYLTEGEDRASLTLPDDQDGFVSAVAAANPDTVVVMHAGAPVVMPWLDEVDSVLLGWYPGQEDGNTTAQLLFGDAEPTGRLPITFPASDDDIPTDTPESYPGNGDVVVHEEDLEVGYRHYLANGVEPLFPFGFGLSYGDIELAELRVPDALDGEDVLSGDDQVGVEVTLDNVGRRAGTEVVQVYVSAPEEVGTPSKELRGFAKVRLRDGDSETVTVDLSERTFAHWDTEKGDWVVTPGTYEVLVGTSSHDTPLSAEIEVR